MNVNELADKLDSISYECTLEEWRESPVGMAAAMLRQQQAEIEALKKFKAEIDAENKKLFEAVQRANDVWDKATGKAQEK